MYGYHGPAHHVLSVWHFQLDEFLQETAVMESSPRRIDKLPTKRFHVRVYREGKYYAS